jgi:hypothetical protein
VIDEKRVLFYKEMTAATEYAAVKVRTESSATFFYFIVN